MLATRPGTTELLRSIACYDLVGLHEIVAMVASTAAGRPAVACRREMEQPVLLQKMDRAEVGAKAPHDRDQASPSCSRTSNPRTGTWHSARLCRRQDLDWFGTARGRAGTCSCSAEQQENTAAARRNSQKRSTRQDRASQAEGASNVMNPQEKGMETLSPMTKPFRASFRQSFRSIVSAA